MELIEKAFYKSKRIERWKTFLLYVSNNTFTNRIKV